MSNSAIDRIHSLPKLCYPLGNAELLRLLELLGNPQNSMEFVHIAGTNGKGSTAAMTDSILRAAGYKTGLFTSPFIEVFNERIRFYGVPIPDDRLEFYTDSIFKVTEENNIQLSEFAFIFALALLYYRDCDCRIAVVEVGLGGALDATNIISNPLCAVICTIGLDHTEYLGDTLAEIAKNKGGIIKENSNVVINRSVSGEALDVLLGIAKEKSAAVTIAPPSSPTKNGAIIDGIEYSLSLKGSFQHSNAATVFSIIGALRREGLNIPEAAVRKGFSETAWAVRYEFITENILLDGSHNPDAALALFKALKADRNGRNIILLIAMMQDKDCSEVMKILAPLASHIIVTELPMPRAMPAEKLGELAKQFSDSVTVLPDLDSAFEFSLGFLVENPIICACGSLYLSAEVRKLAKQKFFL